MSTKKTYKPTKEQLDLCYEAGYNNQTIAKLLKSLGISKGLYYQHSILNEQFKKGKIDGLPALNTALDTSLYKEAFGYFIEEETFTRNKEGEMVLTTKVRKYQRPNATLIMFLKVNKDPDNYQSINRERIIIDKDKQSLGITFSKYSEN